jgi:hypothetical protein
MEISTWLIHIKDILNFNDNFSVFSNRYHHLIRDCVYTSVNRLIWCKESLWFCTRICSNCDCSHIHTSPISCKHNFCNNCWIRALEKWFNHLTTWIPLHIQYIHIIFTIPQEFRDFLRMYRREWAMNVLFDAAHKTLLTFFRWHFWLHTRNCFGSSHFLSRS